MATADESEPVIASSNRFHDIEPYITKLFAKDPQTWAQILPWEFPQNGSMEQEQTFIRKFFDEREIRMQGGEPDGFRFLKQVWYSAAIWNVERRLPAVVNWWFEHNQDILNDPDMKQHLFKPDVQPSTFFTTDEIKMYGEKLLHWAVKQIQYRIAPPAIESPAEKDSTSITAPTAPTAVAVPIHQSSTLFRSPSLQSTEGAVATPFSAPAQLVRAFKLNGSGNQTLNHNYTDRRRNFSGEPYTNSDPRQIVNRKHRGLYDHKQNTFGNPPPNQRPPPGLRDPRHVSGQMMPYGTPNYSMSFPVPVQGHVASSTMLFNPRDTLTAFQRGQQVQASSTPPTGCHAPAQSQYGQPFDPGAQSMAALPTYQPGSFAARSSDSSYYNNPPPFVDRSNIMSDRLFGNNPQFFPHDGSGDGRPKQRRESVTSRGKGRGYNGSVRGRSSRGRNSFGQHNNTFDGRGFDRNSINGTDAASADHQPPRDRRYSMRDKNVQGPNWRVQNHDENSTPKETPRRDDARFNDTEWGATHRSQFQRPGTQMHELQTQSSNTPHATSYAQAPGRNIIERRSYQNDEPMCTERCSKDVISGSCTIAKKLVARGVPLNMPEADFRRLFESFGKVDSVRFFKPASLPEDSPYHYAFVTFFEVGDARNCLSSGPLNPYPDVQLHLENAKGHWDLERRLRYQNLPYQGFAPQPVENHPPSTKLTPKADELGPGAPVRDIVANGTTPTMSGTSTPKKKKSRDKKRPLKNGVPAMKSDTIEMRERQDSLLENQATAAGVGILESSKIAQAKASANTMARAPSPNLTNDVSVHVPEIPLQKESPPIWAQDSVSKSSSEQVHSASQPELTESEDTKQAEGTDGKEERADTGPEPVAEHEASVGQPKEEDTAACQDISKPDDEAADDSFHTASGSPDLEPEAGIAKTAEAIPASSSTLSISQPTGNHTPAVDEEMKLPAPEITEDLIVAKKAPIPQISYIRNISKALVPADNHPDSGTEKPRDNTCQTLQQSSNPEGSETVALAPVIESKPSSQPQIRPKPEAQKTTKPKGPEQTPSLSIFGKQSREKGGKKTKKGKVGSMRGKPKAEATAAMGGDRTSSPAAPAAKGSTPTTPKTQSNLQRTESQDSRDRLEVPIPSGTLLNNTERSDDIRDDTDRLETSASPEMLHTDKEQFDETVPPSVADKCELDRAPAPMLSNKARRGTIFGLEVANFVPNLFGKGSTGVVNERPPSAISKEIQVEQYPQDGIDTATTNTQAQPFPVDANNTSASQTSKSELHPLREMTSNTEDGPDDSVGLGISTAGAILGEGSKAKKKKSKKPKRKSKEAKAEVTNMSLLVRDNERMGNFVENRVNDAGSETSSRTVESATTLSPERTPGKKPLIRIGRAKPSIETGSPPRKHVRNNSRNGSTSPESGGTNDHTPLLMTDLSQFLTEGYRRRNASGQTDNTSLLILNLRGPDDSQAPQARITEAEELDLETDEFQVSPEVEASRERLKQMKEAEDRMKKAAGKAKANGDN